jgi:hypothetical protein
MDENKVQDSDYVNLITLQLEHSHNSNLLVFSRDKATQNLAKKLKSEFNRVFFSSDVRECQKMVASYSNITQTVENNNVMKIDVVLSEYDPSALKLIDYVLRRPFAPETNDCPIVPVVLLVNSSSERDAKDHFDKVGGSVKYVKSSTSPKDLLMTMIEVLYGCRKIEDIFKDVKKNQLTTSKFPYLPIFESSAITSSKDSDDGSQSIKTGGSSSVLSQNKYQVDEIEDVSECASLLPEIVSKSPQRMEIRRNKQEQELENDEIQRKKEDTEREEMRKWRENQFKKLDQSPEIGKVEPVPEEPSFKIERRVSIK